MSIPSASIEQFHLAGRNRQDELFLNPVGGMSFGCCRSLRIDIAQTSGIAWLSRVLQQTALDNERSGSPVASYLSIGTNCPGQLHRYNHGTH